MAIPTREECISFAQSLLSDSAGEVFTSSVLSDPFDAAFRILYAEMQKDQVARVKKIAYCNLAAYSTQLTPALAGIADFGEIVNLEERGVGATANISAATNATPIQITTSTAHGLSTDTEVTISGVTGNTAANGRWFISVVDSTNFTLIGSAGNAAYVSGGVVTTSTDRFQIVVQRSELPQRDPADTLNVYAWEEDTLKFIGSTTQRQLRIAYFSSGAPPASGSVGVDDSKNFLSYMTASLGGYMKGRIGAAGDFDVMARGPRKDCKAGFIYDLLQPMVRTMQRQPVRQKPYRAGWRSDTPAVGFVYNPATGTSTMPYQWYFIGQTIDGSNATFTLDRAPIRQNLYKNGQLMTDSAGGAPTADYSISGVTITFQAASIPQTGDTLFCEYWTTT